MSGRQFILHRVNTLESLRAIEDRSWGCEIDLRSDVSKPGLVHLAHDPWTAGADFAIWLSEFRLRGMTGTLILNTKEDGLETRLLEMLDREGVKNFFFLDTALPTLRKWSFEKDEHRFAIRYSSCEPPEFVGQFTRSCDWIWVDCFGTEPVDVAAIRNLPGRAKICLVSPELQGGTEGDLKKFGELHGIANAICTKRPDWWVRAFGT